MKKPASIIWLIHGTIGDGIMLSCLFSYISRIPDHPKLTIYTYNNKSLLRDIFASYSEVKILDFSFLNFLYIDKEALYITQPTFGKHFWKTKLAAKLILLFGGNLVSFFDKADKSLGGIKLRFNLDDSFFNNIKQVLRYMGISDVPGIPKPDLKKSSILREHLDLDENDYIVLHPFAGSETRTLSASRWRDIIRSIKKFYPNLKIIITGGKENRINANNLCGGDKNLISVAGEATFFELTDIIENAFFYIGVDTGVTHLAAILQKKSIVIANLSNPSWLPTYNKNSIILFNKRRCTCAGNKTGNCFIEAEGKRYYKCMYDITPEQVENAIKSISSK